MEATTATKTPIKEMGFSKENEKATPGHFRACVMLDSCIYQIGDDTPDRLTALLYCQEYANEMQLVQIFDDQGETHIVNGKLKYLSEKTVVYNKDNSFFTNAKDYFDKIMKKTYVTKPELITLKGQFKRLKEQDPSYTNIFNQTTRIANSAKGNNPVTILTKTYTDFQGL